MIFFTIPTNASRRAQPEQVESMYRKYADMIYRIAFVRTLNASDSEDVLQEVFCRYIRFNPGFADDGHERAWFIRTAVNCSNTLLTSAWKRHAALSNELGNEPGEDAAEDITDRMERDTEVYHAVMQLPKDQRTAVHLYYYEECTVDQIAKLTSSSRSAVKSRLFRAREELRRQLKEEIDV